MRIDAHQHFWIFDPVRDSWIDESMAAIQRDFLPADLKPVLDRHQIDGCVAVQADQSGTETNFLVKLASENDFIKAVVGWVDLQAKNIDEQLTDYNQFKKLKGFRHVLQGDPDRALMLKPAFIHGIKELERYNFTYDILIFPDQLGYAEELVKSFPNQKFVIDHIAKPYIKKEDITDWARDITAVAQQENVWCKVSGMVTEADWQNWQETDFEPYLDVVFNAFGSKRLMFGSDWPVCNVAGGYDRMIGMVKNYTVKLSADEQADFWGNNAGNFYNI
jgi:L-fuconolactonase